VPIARVEDIDGKALSDLVKEAAKYERVEDIDGKALSDLVREAAKYDPREESP
jgi:hypothetical protein